MIFSEGEVGRDTYVVIEGAAKLVRFAHNEEFIIDVLGPGELFGEMARRIWFAHQRLIFFRIEDPLVRMYAYV